MDTHILVLVMVDYRSIYAWQEVNSVHLHELVHLRATCLCFCLLGLINFNAHITADEVIIILDSAQGQARGLW